MQKGRPLLSLGAPRKTSCLHGKNAIIREIKVSLIRRSFFGDWSCRCYGVALELESTSLAIGEDFSSVREGIDAPEHGAAR
jgi:hypothetical protein